MTTKTAKRKLESNGVECPVGEKKQKSTEKANSKDVPPVAVKNPKGQRVSQIFKKRKTNGYVEPSMDKKTGQQAAESFRRELETGVMAMSAIRHFLQEAYTNPEMVLHYIKCGGTFKPLLAILSSCEKDKLNDIADVLHLVQLILLQSLDYDETHVQYAIKCVRSIMTNYQTVICSLLQDQGANDISSKASALRLLKAVLLVDGVTYWRDVLQLVDTSSAKMGMTDHRESIARKEGFIGNSLRTAFIEFNLAFLIDTPSQMVRFWLARHSLVYPLILNLVFDSSENVVLVMKTLQQYVLDNPDIDKYIYRTAFTPEILKALVHVYEWVGPAKQQITEQAKQQVLCATEEFLLPLLTSRRCFLVPKSVDLERASPRYRQLLQHLKHTQLHAHQRRLVLGMLEMCPEVLPATLSMYGGLMKTKSLEIREMLKNMILLCKPAELFGKLEKGVSAKTLSAFIVQTTLPRTILEHIAVALDAQSGNIPYCLEFLALMVTRCEECLQAIESSGILDQFGRTKVKVDAINKLVAMFPSIDRIMTAMQTHRDSCAVDRAVVVTLEHAMDILLVCIRSFRAYIDSSSFITTFRSILKPTYRNPVVEKLYLNYEFKAIKVIIALEPQSVAFSSDLFPSVFLLLTKAYINGTSDMRRDATEQLLALLRNTALFGNRGTEIEFWFQALSDMDSPKHIAELVLYLANKLQRAAQLIGQQANAKATIDHSLINEAFNFEASSREDELNALFDRVEQETDRMVAFAGSEALLDAQVELPVADNFFMYIFDKATERPEQFRLYFEGVALRYLHYIPHPEIVHRAVKALEDGSVSSALFKYANKWLTNKESTLVDIGREMFRPLSSALVAKDKSFTLDKKLDRPTDDVRGVLLNMFHQTMFYFSRWVASGKLTPNHVEITKHYCNLLLEGLLRPGVLSERDIGELLEGVFLQRPAIFQNFTISKQDEDSTRRQVSEFVYNLMQMMHHLPHFENYTELYSNKMTAELIQMSKDNAATQLDGELAKKLLTIFKLNERHCVMLLQHYAQLPADVFVAANERSYHYQQLCLALQQLIVRNQCRQENYLPEEAVRGLVRIYMECGQGEKGSDSQAVELDELEQTLCDYFAMFPHSIAHIDPDLMRVFFDNKRRISKATIKLATFLLGRSSHLHGPFLELVGQNTAKKDLVYPLLNVAFRRGIITEATMENAEVKSLMTQIYAEFKGPILKMLEKPNKAAVIYRENALASEQLVRLCMPRNECVDFGQKKLRIEAVESFQLRVLMEIYGAALKTSTEGGNLTVQQTIYCNGFTVLLQCFEALFRSISSAQYLLQQDAHMQRLNELTLATYRWVSHASRYHIKDEKMTFGTVTKTGQWTTFCKNCLKFGLETVRRGDNDRRFDERLHVLPKLMAVLVELFYIDGQKQQTDIERYYEWALSHSNFLRVLLLQYQYQPKTALVQLLYALARKNPTVANEKHVPLLLGAYGATLTDANRYILALLQHYERSGVRMHEFRPFLWGETAIKHFSLESRGAGDETSNGHEGTARRPQKTFRTKVSEVFSLLTEDKVINMIENFPVWRKLDACAQLPETNFDQLAEQSDSEKRDLLVNYQANSPVERFVEKTHRGRKLHPQSDLLEMLPNNSELNSVTYDPAFLMPMLNYMYSSEQSDMLRRSIRYGILTLPFLCLASNDEQMRLAAGSVLLRIRSHLQLTKRLTDAKTWLHLLAIVQRRFIDMYATAASYNESVHTQGHVPRAPYLSMLFIAETVKLLPNVLSKLHTPMMTYVINQDVYNFRMVPNFLPLFNSSDVENNVQRMFMVRTLYLGVKTHRDFAVLRASPIIQVMMGFHGSPLSNRELNMAILNLLNAIAKIPKSCQYLVDSLGFVGWLSERIDVIESFEFDTIEAFLGLLSDCWYSMQVMACSYKTASRHQQPRSTVFFQRGILILTLKFLPLLSPRSTSTTLVRFLNLLEKTTSPWYGYQHLMSLVSAEVMQQLVEYFETLFSDRAEHGDLLWCVRYVRTCGTFGIDDDLTMGRKLQDVGVDQTTILVLLALRRFVMRWCNCQKGDTGIEVTDELEEVNFAMEAGNTANEDDEDGNALGNENVAEEET
uniref:Nucleolar pre-ribosomal-associated protein 1 n=1 Tax=Anopheles funestus TaxID=62324 RepID=A0A182RST1_ANOFN